MDSESVFEKISHEYYNLTVSEKKTADYILSHQTEAQYLSIAELADASGVAEATVSRFCRRLGYKGFNAFKIAIANSAAVQKSDGGLFSEQADAEDAADDIGRRLYAVDNAAMLQTLELLDPEAVKTAADMLRSANKVLCMGQGGSMLIAMEAAHIFSTVSGKFFPVSDVHQQTIAAVNLTPDDVVLYFSYSGATRDIISTLSLIRAQGAKTILVTRFPKAPGAAYADVVLRCGSRESPLQLGSVAAKIAQLFLLDILFYEYCSRDLEQSRDSRSRIAAALAEKHI